MSKEMEQRERDAMIDSLMMQRDDRGEKVPGYAPPPDKEAKWKALTAVGSMPKWNGTMKGVMTCLIAMGQLLHGEMLPHDMDHL